MDSIDLDADLEQLMRRWHHTTEFATAAWAEYQSLRELLPAGDHRIAKAHGRWQAAESERRALTITIERLEEAEAA
jgi:hypothetical protein